MFVNILTFELRHWIRQPAVYVYAAILMPSAMALMHGMAGGWDEPAATEHALRLANSPLRIHEMMSFFTQFFLFLIPAIIGVSVYRDYKSNMHAVLYSYPVKKDPYLLAKFCSSFIVVILLVVMIGVGMCIGAHLPGVPESSLGPFRIAAFLQTYGVFVIPNVLWCGIAVFAAVVLTRNIYAGFIVIILLYFLQSLAGGYMGEGEGSFIAAVLDPFGNKAAVYHTRHWTLAEQNERLLPVQGAVLGNRIFWLLVAAALFAVLLRLFSFSQNAISLGFKKRAGQRSSENNITDITKIKLPKLHFDFSLRQQLNTTWALSNIELKSMLKSWMFISILCGGSLMIFVQQAQMNPQHGFQILPVTWRMLRLPAFLFSGVINILTFLYAGMLVHRARLARTDPLVEATAMPDWSLFLSKFIALLKMQALLLLLVMLGGMAVQAYRGYYHFEIGHYLFELYALNFAGHVIWACAAMFIQTVLANPYLGFFVLLLGSVGITSLPEIGIEHFVFRFNMSPEVVYSDMNGYGHYLTPFFLYKAYWALLGIFLLIASSLFWTRGRHDSFKERLTLLKMRFRGKIAAAMIVLAAGFFGVGFWIYYEDQVANKRPLSAKSEKELLAAAGKQYKKYERTIQPKIVAVNLAMNIFPESGEFTAQGEYLLVNNSVQRIDTVLLSLGFDTNTRYYFSQAAVLLSKDSIIKFEVLRLQKGIQPGDSLKFIFDLQNVPRTLFRASSKVLQNGTFIGSEVFPRFFHRSEGLVSPPSDSAARNTSYVSKDADWIDFAAIVSTSRDQIAIAPGQLQREWLENGRRFFHYKTEGKIKYYFGFNSGRFEVRRDTWNGVALEIYHHKQHAYHLDRMMRGLKACLDYQTRNFGPYRYRQARIIEFPISYGTHATAIANVIPMSELRFIAEVDDAGAGALDIPFYVAAHELAHHWWGNQVVPANALGAKMITESMAEYAALKALEQEQGKTKMRRFLQNDLDRYLSGRAGEQQKENPLLYCDPNQQYLAYGKGALAFHALNNYLGEENLNRALKAFLEKVRWQGPPYTTSIEMMEYVRQATPDSMQYLIEDMFETVTLYDLRVAEAAVTPLPHGRYRVDIEFLVSKYRGAAREERTYEDSPGDALWYQTDHSQDSISSLPLADYIEVGVFGEEGGINEEADGELYLNKHLITQINNKITVIVSQKPTAVGVDPYGKLIDARPRDNRRKL